MKIHIGRKFEFEACHFLPGKDIYGECSNLHGHRYELEVIVAGEINENGWLFNFKDLKRLVEYFEVPTAENMGAYIFQNLSEELKKHNMTLKRIKLNETSKCYVEITEN